jgi:hypothetical protein
MWLNEGLVIGELFKTRGVRDSETDNEVMNSKSGCIFQDQIWVFAGEQDHERWAKISLHRRSLRFYFSLFALS